MQVLDKICWRVLNVKGNCLEMHGKKGNSFFASGLALDFCTSANCLSYFDDRRILPNITPETCIK